MTLNAALAVIASSGHTLIAGPVADDVPNPTGYFARAGTTVERAYTLRDAIIRLGTRLALSTEVA